MADEQVDEEVPEEVAIIEELDPAPAEKTGFGLGSVADGADDPIIDQPIDEWLDGISFETTGDVPIPDCLVDQVIGQEDAAVVILSLIHISEPTRRYAISYAVFC